jgi:hypothetical protein
MDADEPGKQSLIPTMVNGVVTGIVVVAAPPCLRERGGGGNPTPRSREWAVAEPPPRPVAAAAPTWRPRFWPGVVAAAPADPFFLRAMPTVDISLYPCSGEKSATARRGRQMRRQDVASRTLWDRGR